jgi:hypothetical protein
MTRIHAVAAGAAAAVALAATAMSTAAITPVLAAARPTGTTPAKSAPAKSVPATSAKGTDAKTGKTIKTGKTAKGAKTKIDPVTIVSQYANGKYMSVLHCQGISTPPPIRLKAPGTPLTLKGTGPSAGQTAGLSTPPGYQTVYKCTIVVQERPVLVLKPRCELAPTGPGSGGPGAAVCHQQVSISTGFGGEAASVARHHPRG